MERWIGKVAIVTGASSGIGAAVAERLVDEGMMVVGLARRVDKMEELARTLSNRRGSFHPIRCDVSIKQDILDAFQTVKETLSPVHVLVNNAGIARVTQTLCSGDSESWNETFLVNVLGLCICTREAIQDMIENDVDGHIIHMNSVLGHSVPKNLLLSTYPATKSAVKTLAECLRLEFNAMKSKIKITNLSPGIVATEIFETSGVSAEALQEAMGGEVPALDVKDIADGVAYVLSTPPNVLVSELTIRPLHEII
ncbi:farnesol dehydrogenase-like [Diabrotica undecimpunctata]|uniref:farnesol dehydrogenase-like n=1 Tax=Diabrotica undecimpunctata TaxID=50387 RepID=UPI003B6320F6